MDDLDHSDRTAGGQTTIRDHSGRQRINVIKLALEPTDQSSRRLISGFHRMKRLGVFGLSLDAMLVYQRSYPTLIYLLPTYTCTPLGGERHCASRKPSLA